MKLYMYLMDGFIQYFAKAKGNHAYDDAIVAEVKAIAKKRKIRKQIIYMIIQ